MVNQSKGDDLTVVKYCDNKSSHLYLYIPVLEVLSLNDKIKYGY